LPNRSPATCPSSASTLILTLAALLFLGPIHPQCSGAEDPPADATGARSLMRSRSYSLEDDRAMLKHFDGLRVADLSDGMDAVGLQDVGLMDRKIAPLWRDLDTFAHRFCGIAVTVRYVPTNWRMRPTPGNFHAEEGRWYADLSPEPFVALLREGRSS